MSEKFKIIDGVEESSSFVSTLECELSIQMEERGVHSKFTSTGHRVAVRAIIEILDSLPESEKIVIMKMMKNRKIQVL